MERWELYMVLASGIPAIFVFAYGACVGSLINVIAYRLPLGLGIVSPPSRCPSCATRLTWRENVPVVGWLLLKGRCRFCKSKISAEYPLVEAITGALFLFVYACLYLVPTDAAVFGVALGEVRPDWARSGPGDTWPIAIVWLMLTGSLIAMTITDLKTYTIPLVLTWVPAIVAVLLYPVFAAILGDAGLRRTAPNASWSIPVVGSWRGLGGIFGALLGLVVSNLMLAKGLLRQSFADYDEWARQAQREAAQQGEPENPDSGDAETLASTEDEQAPPDTPDMWIQYPHARREMVKELAFLAPACLLWFIGQRLGAGFGGESLAPLWLQVLGGVGFGYLVGGAVVWGVRIFGSLLFGKEAMGLGDVHLLAGVGACLGWIDSVFVFFTSVFVALGAAVWGLVVALYRRKPGEKLAFPRMLAFGPFLAIATLLVMVGKPLYEWFLGVLMHQPGGVQLP